MTQHHITITVEYLSQQDMFLARCDELNTEVLAIRRDLLDALETLVELNEDAINQLQDSLMEPRYELGS